MSDDPSGKQQPYQQQPDPGPGYGPPGYPPPGYGPPGYGPQGYGPPQRGTNTFAILALVFAFIFSPLGIVFGALGRKQIDQTGEEGRGLATAGLIIGIVFTALYVLLIIVYVIFIVAFVSTVSEFEPTTTY